jgi:hypothetical protein
MQGNDDKLVWNKSSFSNGSGECVEVAVTDDGGRKVRDSKNPEGVKLDFTPGEWTAFLLGAKAGEFDN